MAVADASFKISIDSISLGLIVASAFSPAPDPAPVDALLLSLYTGKPSITYSGSFPPVIEFPPRMRMLEELPGWPELWVTCTPGTAPCITLSTEGVTRFKFSLGTEETE